MNSDELQNELIALAHHLHDLEEALASGSSDVVQSSLKDAREGVERMKGMLPKKVGDAVDRWITPEEIADNL